MFVKIMIIAVYRCLKEINNVLKYNHGEKSMKLPFVIYTDSESLLEQIDTCHSNPKRLSTAML